MSSSSHIPIRREAEEWGDRRGAKASDPDRTRKDMIAAKTRTHDCRMTRHENGQEQVADGLMSAAPMTATTERLEFASLPPDVIGSYFC